MRYIAALILIATCAAFGGLAFGVNPIGPLRESYIGFEAGNVIPYGSLNFYNGKESYKRRDADDPEYSDTTIYRAGILIPTAGAKVFLGSGSELKPFVRASVGMPFLLYLRGYDNDYDAQEELDEFKEDLGLMLIYGGGAGVEYFFARSFSIGGEFNYRALSAGLRDTYSGVITRTRLNIGGTSTGVWLNYYF
jgi:hypothetical protein